MSRYERMTIKLVMQALNDNSPNGATCNREFIPDAYGRTIDGDGLRPQPLDADEGLITYQVEDLGGDGRWVVTIRGATADDLIAIGRGRASAPEKWR